MRKNTIREKRFAEVIVVDAYNEEERAMGWHCYLDERLKFPFTARCVKKRSISPLKPGEDVVVEGMADEDDCMNEMFVTVKWSGRSLGVPLVQLAPVKADKATTEAVADWHYWMSQGYVF